MEEKIKLQCPVFFYKKGEDFERKIKVEVLVKKTLSLTIAKKEIW